MQTVKPKTGKTKRSRKDAIAKTRSLVESQKFTRSCLIIGIREVWRRHGVTIAAPRFRAHWSKMFQLELEECLHYIGSVLAAAPQGSWQDVQINDRVTLSYCDGMVWTACVGFATLDEARRFARWVASDRYCALNTEPRKSKRTHLSWEVKVWCPEVALLGKLIAFAPAIGADQTLKSQNSVAVPAETQSEAA